jgi:hypothetical protein
MAHELSDTQHYLCNAPKEWFHDAFHHVINNHNFKEANLHLKAHEWDALINHLEWPKTQPIFCPYEPSSSGYGQVTLCCPNLDDPTNLGDGKDMKFSLHVLAAVYKSRFISSPTMKLHTTRMMEGLFTSEPQVQASHLMENFKEASLSFNPLLLTLEVGEVNKSRHACSIINAILQQHAMHPNDPMMSAGGSSKLDPTPETSLVKFKCKNPTIHDPPCLGFNFNIAKVPAFVKRMWAKHKGRQMENREKKWEEQKRHAHMSKMEVLKEKHDEIEEEMSKLQVMARHKGKGKK